MVTNGLIQGLGILSKEKCFGGSKREQGVERDPGYLWDNERETETDQTPVEKIILEGS